MEHIRIGLQESTVEEVTKEADERGISRSKYVRRMMHGGRRDLGIAVDEETTERGDGQQESTELVRGNTLRERALHHLEEGRENATPEEEVLEAIRSDIDDRIRDTLADLSEEGLVAYRGGYYIPE